MLHVVVGSLTLLGPLCSEFIQKRIKDEVSRQVDMEMKKQMYPNHLHRPLQEDVDEGSAQVIAMKAALANSYVHPH